MKYLENFELEQLNDLLTNKEVSGGRLINGRIEVYSTKRAGDDKKQSKALEQKLGGSSPSTPESKSSIKLLIDLIQTLNASLLDYDFSGLSTDSFLSLTVPEITTKVNSYLAELTSEDPSFLTKMWQKIDESIKLQQCEGYCLRENPFLEAENGIAWSFIFFFFNKELKRICFFSCNAACRYRRNSVFGSVNDEEEDEDEDFDQEEDAYQANESEDELMEVSDQEM